VVGADGTPLSKRTGSRSVQELREAGFLAAAVNNYLGRLGHTYDSNSLMELTALAMEFSTERLHRAPARFDEQHLHHWQREAIRHASTDELWNWLPEQARGLVPGSVRDAFLEVVRGNVLFPPDAERWARVVFGDALEIAHDAHQAIETAGKEYFDIARRAIEKHGDDFKALSSMVQHLTGRSGKALFQPLRAALTGVLDGPEMAKLLPLIGSQRARERLVRWINHAGG